MDSGSKNISCFVCAFRKSVSRDLGPIGTVFMQYGGAREFPDCKKCSANNLSIDLLVSNSHGLSMYTLSMHFIIPPIGQDENKISENRGVWF